MLLLLLEKGKDKFIVELGKIAARTFVRTAATNITKMAIDEIHNLLKADKDDKTSDKEEKEDTTKKED